jgi:hypothetical protein
LAKTLRTIGRTDKIDLPDLGLEDVQAKIDTGAYTSAIHCAKIRLELTKEGTHILHYTIQGSKLGKGKKSVRFSTAEFKLKNIKSSNGEVQQRYVIKTKVRLFQKKFSAEFSLSDRSRMKNPILLGRKLLQGRYLVDVAQEDVSYNEKLSRLENK